MEVSGVRQVDDPDAQVIEHKHEGKAGLLWAPRAGKETHDELGRRTDEGLVLFEPGNRESSHRRSPMVCHNTEISRQRERETPGQSRQVDNGLIGAERT